MNFFQHQKMDSAIIFSFNILRSVYSSFNLAHFQPINKILSEEHNITSLLPIINYEETTIEKRAEIISKKLPEILEKLHCKKAHIISYSVSGIDFRYYISQMKGDEYIKSLTTLSSPHMGSILAESLDKKLIKSYHIEPVTRMMGIGLHSFKEFSKENIESFNLLCMNSDKLKYFSVGASKQNNMASEMLRIPMKFISENRMKHFINDNDGAFALDECKWGKHLLNYAADHADLIGLGPEKEWGKIHRFCCDNIKFEDHENHPLKYINPAFS